jgi:hypothetical protein
MYNCAVEPAIERKPSTKLETATAALLRSTKFRSWRHSLDPGGLLPVDPKLSATEIHLSPAELAKKWGVSTETVRTIFREEPGVLKIGKPGTKFRRGYFTLRIPESVAERVHRRLSERAA